MASIFHIIDIAAWHSFFERYAAKILCDAAKFVFLQGVYVALSRVVGVVLK